MTIGQQNGGEHQGNRAVKTRSEKGAVKMHRRLTGGSAASHPQEKEGSGFDRGGN